MVQLIIYCDGLCESRNPGGIGSYGIMVYLRGKRIAALGGIVGEGPRVSNNVAEYAALCRALRWLLEENQALLSEVNSIVVRSDSQLLVNQMSGRWKVHEGLYVEKFSEACLLQARFTRIQITYEWVRRELNAESDAISRRYYENYCLNHGRVPRYHDSSQPTLRKALRTVVARQERLEVS